MKEYLELKLKYSDIEPFLTDSVKDIIDKYNSEDTEGQVVMQMKGKLGISNMERQVIYFLADLKKKSKEIDSELEK